MTRNGRFRGSTAQHLPRRRQGAGESARWRPTRWRPGCCSTGRRCIGVAFRQGNEDREIRARREVILCGGAVNSPQLLQISGIGPARASAGDRRAGGARPARGRRQSAGPLRGAHLAPGARRRFDQPAGARGAAGRRGGAVLPDRQRRADLRRHHGSGVRPLPRGTGEPRSATSVHPGELRPGGVRRAGARARHDRGGLPGAPRQPRHRDGRVGAIRSPRPGSRPTTCRRRTTRVCCWPACG